MPDTKKPSLDNQPDDKLAGTAPLLPGAPELQSDEKPRLEKARSAVNEAEDSADQPNSDSSQIDAAVDDITTHEADELLAAEDEQLSKAFEPP
ncbi:MAG: hypothetical protein ABI221_03385, partial [Candidatus Saccharimonadales bacterium]